METPIKASQFNSSQQNKYELEKEQIARKSPTNQNDDDLQNIYLDDLVENGITDAIVGEALSYLENFECSGQARFKFAVILMNTNPELAMQLFNAASLLESVTFAQNNGTEINSKTRNELLLAGCNKFYGAQSWVISYFEKIAQGESEQAIQARYHLGVLLKKTDPTKAIMLIKEAADLHHGEAAFEYAEKFYGDVSQNPLDYLEKVADDYRRTSSIVDYADKCVYHFNDFVSNAFKSPLGIAAHYFEVASNAGHELAEFRLLEILTSKIGSSVEIAGSKITYRNFEPAYRVGISYLRGDEKIGIPQDHTKAKYYLGIAVKGGYFSSDIVNKIKPPMLAYQAAYLFKDDPEIFKQLLKVATDLKYSPALLEQKANNGDLDAAFDLYSLHYFGNSSHMLPADQRKGIHFLCLATAGGHELALDVSGKLINVIDTIIDNESQQKLEKALLQAKDKTMDENLKQQVQILRKEIENKDENQITILAEELKNLAFSATHMDSKTHNYSIQKSSKREPAKHRVISTEALLPKSTLSKNAPQNRIKDSVDCATGAANQQSNIDQVTNKQAFNYLDLIDESVLSTVAAIDKTKRKVAGKLSVVISSANFDSIKDKCLGLVQSGKLDKVVHHIPRSKDYSLDISLDNYRESNDLGRVWKLLIANGIIDEDYGQAVFSVRPGDLSGNFFNLSDEIMRKYSISH